MTKSYQGKCKKATLKFEIPMCYVVLMRDENVVLTSNNS